MISRMKARYSKGVIVPLEAHDLEEGANLFVSVEVETYNGNPRLEIDDECLNQQLDDLYIEDYFEKERQ